MNRPKTPSELHPNFPKWTKRIDATLGTVHIPPSPQEYIDFYKAHPEFADEGDYEYRCGGCGDEIDPDHDYCRPCDMRGGEWVYVDQNGEESDPPVPMKPFPVLVSKCEHENGFEEGQCGECGLYRRSEDLE